jgi:glutathione S-transferase
MKAAVVKAAKRAEARARRLAKPRAAPVKKAAKPDDTFILNGLYLSLPSCKVGLMLSLCGAKWHYKHIDLMAGEHKRPEFQAKNRFGQVPVLEHAGNAICQSNVILQYLADHFGRFTGRTPAEKLRIAEWLAWDLDRLAVGVGGTRGLTRFVKDADPAVVAFMRNRGEMALGQLDRHLGSSKFVAGPLPTIADVAIFPWVATAEEGGFEIARWPNVRDWAERFLKLSGAAHPYSIMPKEDRLAA